MTMRYPFSKRVNHFVPPKQWASMRIAKEMEKNTGKKVIHFEKGDYQGPDFDTPDFMINATTKALKEGYVRYDPGPGLSELRELIAQEMTRRGRKSRRPKRQKTETLPGVKRHRNASAPGPKPSGTISSVSCH